MAALLSLWRVNGPPSSVVPLYGMQALPTLPSVPMLTLEQLREQARTVKWVVKHAIPADSIGLLYGASGSFKSFIALDLALHVAHGLPWLGRKTQQGPVLIVAAEGGSGLWKRIVAWHRQRGIPWADAPVYVVPIAVDLGIDAQLVREAAQALNVVPALSIVDTLSQTFGGEENSAQEVSTYLREIGTHLRASWQCAVLIVHHIGHAATERPRGSSALRSNVDFMFGCFRDERELLATMECTKQKDGEMLPAVNFSLTVCELLKDEDGDAVTSLVAQHITAAQTLNVMAYEAERGRGGQRQLFLNLAVNGIDEKQLRSLFQDTVDGDIEGKRKAYYRARKWAVMGGIVEIAQGVVIRLDQRADYL